VIATDVHLDLPPPPFQPQAAPVSFSEEASEAKDDRYDCKSDDIVPDATQSRPFDGVSDEMTSFYTTYARHRCARKGVCFAPSREEYL
jgi:hypothetical protein